MPITWDNKKTEELVKAILALKNKSEAKRFLRDLLTPGELEEFGNRWLAARMLNAKISYTTIRGRTGLSSTTIARISKWLKKGKGGYRLILNRLGSTHHHSKLLSGKRLS
ncbi:MAG: DNA-binding transcriptional regulator [Candidatus Doudnabacteria bacterium CG10_big_fil_rev_8_21_14_0_10_42_18]|uniref:DNA-binding transcriptional regulator n=1 Tax=Candidatus Doudnabacteria bacterium CG10_big_fil_rev_8_21_14_0_10_42_18 TaxID=1974552 RepID=A0A2H0VDS9_9BACT|nr:MAG: DNA-binding transcriptional regulator [Candidatus Doudnabacteria bacterium CG10_big_fil_rev_8_21_14_0_10_42_18]